MALLTVCQHTFQNVQAYDDAVEGVEALKVNVREWLLGDHKDLRADSEFCPGDVPVKV